MAINRRLPPAHPDRHEEQRKPTKLLFIEVDDAQYTGAMRDLENMREAFPAYRDDELLMKLLADTKPKAGALPEGAAIPLGWIIIKQSLLFQGFVPSSAKMGHYAPRFSDAADGRPCLYENLDEAQGTLETLLKGGQTDCRIWKVLTKP